MRVPIAIVIAGALIAGAVLFVFRWQISATPTVVYRLDRWTGRTVWCYRDAADARRPESTDVLDLAAFCRENGFGQ
jgi:hypothetical protein